MKILVVEDDPIVAPALKILLSSYNYAVDFATGGEAGLQMAKDFAYDLMVLDVVLPRLDGISLCQQLRSNGFQNPILLLTVQAGEQQKAIALNAGADDSIVKPFDSEELIARIQALLRRGGSTAQPTLSWGNLSIDPNSRKVTYGIHLLSVTPKGYAILELLLRHPQKIFSASAILEHAWTSTETPGEATVRGHIKELRQKLKAVGAPKDLIKTVYKIGYRLNLLYSPVLAEPVEQQPAMPQAAELAAVNEELRITLEQLRSTQAALHQKNQELEIAYQTIEQKQQQLQAVQDELERRVAERTAELSERIRLEVERQQAETAIQKSEEQLRLALDLTHVGAWDWDMVTGAVTWSSNQYPLLGYLPGEIEVSYQLWRDRVHPDDIDWVEQTVTEALAAQRDINVEYRVVLPDSTIRWILTKGRGIYNELGQPVRVVGFNFDISDRKQLEAEQQQTEATLRLSEEQRRLALDLTNTATWDLDLATGTVVWSDYMFRLFGLPIGAAEPSHLLWRQCVHPDDIDRLETMVQIHLQNQTLHSEEYRVIHPDGSIHWVLSKGHGIYDADGQAVRMVGITMDITDRKHAEASLRESEERFCQLAENVVETVFWMSDPRIGQLLYVSPAYEQVWGRSCASLYANFYEWIEAIHLQDRERVRTTFFEQWITNNYDVEYRVVRPDGSIRWIRDRGFPIQNTEGEPYRMVGMAEDITDRKQAEIELLQREEFLNSIYTGVEQAVFVIDVVEGQNFRYLDFNPVSERYSTSTCQQVKGKTPEEAFGQVQGAILRQNYERCLQAGQKITYEEEIAFPGQIIWTLTTLFPFKNEQGETYRIVGTAINITDRKQLGLSLQASEAKLNRILDSAIAAISSFCVYANRDWEYEYWSAGCERLFGYPLEDYADKYFWLSQIHPDDLEQLILPLFDSFFAEQDITIEYRFRRKDGLIRWFSSSYTSRKIAEDCWIVTTVNHDITDRKQAELTLQQQLSREQLIAEISQEIRQSLDLSTVLTRTVERVREVLNTDRVIVFRFRPNWHGDVIMESVGAEWIPILSTTIFDPCFRDRWVEPYRQGRGAIISDIDAEDLNPCYVELLQQFQVKANLVVPIFQAENLWGLLIAHQCSAPRQWQPSEIDLLRQLAIQVSIAIQQSELYEQTRQELLERERMQFILEESEERFRTLSTTAPIGICQTNADGICLYTNAYWQEMSGRSFEESLGDGWLQAVHPDDRQMLFRAWETYLQNERKQLLPEFRLLTPQGNIRWVSAKVATMRSTTGEIIGYVSLHEDITERKRAEDERKQAEIALRESEQRLQAILDHSPTAIYLLDSQNRFLLVNRICAELLSTTPENAVGKSMYEFWPTEIADAFAANNQAVLETDQLVQTEEVAPLSNGLHTYITVKFSLRDVAGIPYAVCGISTDITEKKQLEAQFYRAQRLESIGTLASGIAHDLNNVFTPILALSQLLRLKAQNLDDRSLEMLKLLSDSAERGVDLVKQILTFARGSEGKRIPLQLEPLLHEIANVTQQTFPKSIAIRKTIPSQPLWLVSADSTHLHQVLMNLCINARDAMPDGGTLTLSAQNQCIDATTARMHPDAKEENYVTITVTDTGVGISPELLDRIFDPFFTTKGPGEGTGLGLSTVLGIVKNHGGFLQVSSRVGKGTQFQVYLPAIAKAIPETTKDEIVLQGNGQVILIVDDEVVVQQTNQTLLESHNFATLVARDGLEAINLYREHQQEIYAVLLDTMMPNMDGLTTLRQLRRINSQVKIIAISGIPSNRQPMLQAGANVFLSKPYTMQELLMAIHEL